MVHPNRRAGVLTIGDYTHLTPLTCTKLDAQLITNALRATGFELPDHHIRENLENTADFYNWLNAVFGEAHADCVFLLHFSGHGATLEHGDYVFCLKSFPRADGGHALSQDHASVIQKSIEYFIGTSKCRPKLVVVAFDSCHRAGNDLDMVEVSTTVRSPKGTYHRPEVSFAFAADVSQLAASRPNGPSYFTEAFADIIAPSHPARTALEALTITKAIVSGATGGQQNCIFTYPVHHELMDLEIFESSDREGDPPPSQPAPQSQIDGPTPAAAFPYADFEHAGLPIRVGLDASLVHEMDPAQQEEVRKLLISDMLNAIARRSTTSNETNREKEGE